MSDWTPERIRELREKRYRETLREFSNRLGMSYMVYWQLERGYYRPGKSTSKLLDMLLDDARAKAIRPQPA